MTVLALPAPSGDAPASPPASTLADTGAFVRVLAGASEPPAEGPAPDGAASPGGEVAVVAGVVWPLSILPQAPATDGTSFAATAGDSAVRPPRGGAGAAAAPPVAAPPVATAPVATAPVATPAVEGGADLSAEGAPPVAPVAEAVADETVAAAGRPAPPAPPAGPAAAEPEDAEASARPWTAPGAPPAPTVEGGAAERASATEPVSPPVADRLVVEPTPPPPGRTPASEPPLASPTSSPSAAPPPAGAPPPADATATDSPETTAPLPPGVTVRASSGHLGPAPYVSPDAAAQGRTEGEQTAASEAAPPRPDAPPTPIVRARETTAGEAPEASGGAVAVVGSAEDALPSDPDGEPGDAPSDDEARDARAVGGDEDAPEADPVASASRTPDAPAGVGPRAPARARPAGVWSALLVQQIGPALEAADEWATLAVDLGDGDGSMTVRARHDEGRLVVAVHLSDPAVGAAARGQADEIRGRLEQHYGTAVDLSFEQGDGGRPSDDARRSPDAPPRPAPARAAPGGRPPSARPPGSRHEWVG